MKALLRKRWFPALWLALGSLVIMTPMFIKNYPYTHSYPWNMSWAFQYSRQFLGGQFYPRWLESSWLSLGSPTFVFYPPLCMVAILPFAWLPTSWALVGSMVLAVWIRGIGFYLLGKKIWTKKITFITALLSMASPYFLVDIYARGAIAEVWAISLLPWLIWGGINAVESKNYLSTSLIFTTALFSLTHLPTLLITILVWLFFPWLFGNWKVAIKFYINTALGLGISSFYLLPAKLDQQWVNIDVISIYNPLERFVINLWQNQQGEQLWFDNMWFQIHFWIPFLLSILLIILILRKKERQLSGVWGFALVSTIIATYFQTDLSYLFYHYSGTLSRIQFPWRWQAITTTTLWIIWGYICLWVEQFNFQKYLARLAYVIGISIGILGISVCLPASFYGSIRYTHYVPDLTESFNELLSSRPNFPQEIEISPEDYEQAKIFLQAHVLYPSGLALRDVAEYSPKTITRFPISLRSLPLKYPLTVWLGEGSPSIEVQEWRYGYRRLDLETTQSGIVVLRMFAYPGWHLLVNGQPHSRIVVEDGRLGVPVSPGKSVVEVIYGGTQAENWGLIMSGSLTLIILWVAYRQKRLLTVKAEASTALPYDN